MEITYEYGERSRYLLVISLGDIAYPTDCQVGNQYYSGNLQSSSPLQKSS